MAGGNSEPVRDVERKTVTGLEPPNATTEVAVGESPLSVEARLRNIERELTESSANVIQAKSGQSSPQATSEQPVNFMSLVFGLGLIAGGAYLLTQRVTIFGGTYFWNRWNLGQNSFGLTLIPLLIGIGLLVYGKTAVGWALTGIGSLIILLGILADLQMTLRPASLFDIFLMLGMLVAGIGLTARSLRRA